MTDHRTHEPSTDSSLAAGNAPTQLDAEQARALRARALSEAQLAVQEHLRRAEELKRAAVTTAWELLRKEPLAGALLASIEQGVLGAATQVPPVALDPLSAMDNLLSERQRSLDETLQRFMREVGARGPMHATEPGTGAS